MDQFKTDARLAEMSVPDRNDYLDEVAEEARAFARFQDRSVCNDDAPIEEDAAMNAYESRLGWTR